jgi:hypothetical protein
VVNVLGAAVVAAVMSVLLGQKFIEVLRARRVGQNIREEGPEGHRT